MRVFLLCCLSKEYRAWLWTVTPLCDLGMFHNLPGEQEEAGPKRTGGVGLGESWLRDASPVCRFLKGCYRDGDLWEEQISVRHLWFILTFNFLIFKSERCLAQLSFTINRVLSMHPLLLVSPPEAITLNSVRVCLVFTSMLPDNKLVMLFHDLLLRHRILTEVWTLILLYLPTLFILPVYFNTILVKSIISPYFSMTMQNIVYCLWPVIL